MEYHSKEMEPGPPNTKSVFPEIDLVCKGCHDLMYITRKRNYFSHSSSSKVQDKGTSKFSIWGAFSPSHNGNGT